MTSLLSNVPTTVVAPKISPVTSPLNAPIVTTAVVLPSYTFPAAVEPVIVRGLAVMELLMPSVGFSRM